MPIVKSRRKIAAVVLVSVAAIATGGGSGFSTRAGNAAEAPISARVDELLGLMTLDEKIGQMTQVSSSQLVGSPSLVESEKLGSVLSGGNDKPAANNPAAWRKMVDGFQAQALRTRLRIPIIYGFDAVHGANDVVASEVQRVRRGPEADAVGVEELALDLQVLVDPQRIGHRERLRLRAVVER